MDDEGMMRGWLMISVLALASCGEQQGWNPNYMFEATRYGEYKQQREVALTTNQPSAQVIPLALPAESMSPEDIAGQSPVPVPVVPGVAVATTAAAATAGNAPTRIVPESMVAGTQGGPYPGSVPVLVQYAYGADHAVGQSIYGRAGASTATAIQVCGTFDDADAAQIAFLAAGGPRKDPRGMDPDGDGYVCGWDPEKFRQAQL
ncbi:hypothetical protein PAF17_17695 [Paracoccus sp. Z330]|uniref:Excalibur calcium-binding domain-containing protein n=1 Tax=Paracoccus onchidii TaxID=3017813 RepID=A0ABT4ZIY6_9RHOB|nr:hypothetical protein [Paracoccus onchidii]MDB6179324.1 hypothetical protein [Paracoccus onchidii]